MITNKKELINYIAGNDALDIYYEYMIGQDVWYFKDSSKNPVNEYDEFKKFIARNLGIPFNNISIVGSAKTKYSFSPNKNFKQFGSHSDFDLIIVSMELYTQIWSAYRAISLERRVYNYSNICSNIFNGFISIYDDERTYGNDVLNEWQRKIRTFKPELQLKFNVKHNVNYRIYSDWDAVQNYHLKSISKLKDELHETK